MTAVNKQVEIFTHQATEAAALVKLHLPSAWAGSSIEIQLTGPRCERARTLPATFRSDPNGTLLVTDPCYWTPQLPFLYDLQLTLQLADDSQIDWKHSIGLRRWDIERRNLLSERRRIVLRGAVIAEPDVAMLTDAVGAEMALLVRDPGEPFLQRASELGVALVIDLRGFQGDLAALLTSYSWHPTVALVLVDEEISRSGDMKIATVVRADSSSCETASGVGDVVVFELGETEHPLAWAATCEKPVIAIRRQGAYAELAEARQACDRLQTDLAPQFDLAGYFV
jgi:hypothetical protein